jgi:hypothetical protein
MTVRKLLESTISDDIHLFVPSGFLCLAQRLLFLAYSLVCFRSVMVYSPPLKPAFVQSSVRVPGNWI